jgi:inhibitor of KinA
VNAAPAHIVAAGEGMLLVELEERIDPAVNGRAIAMAAAIRSAAVAGVRDVVPAYRSVAVYFDPTRTDRGTLADCLQRVISSAPRVQETSRETIRVPVCYGGEFGPDLGAVAAFAGVSEQEAVALHTAGTYRVFMLGFMPGFSYMGTVPPAIAAPRHATPRVRVPAGSVGIAGGQTGIYPTDTPAGWQIIGRTPLRLVDLSRPDPFLFAPGDAVRFVAIDQREYDRAI